MFISALYCDIFEVVSSTDSNLVSLRRIFRRESPFHRSRFKRIKFVESFKQENRVFVEYSILPKIGSEWRDSVEGTVFSEHWNHFWVCFGVDNKRWIEKHRIYKSRSTRTMSEFRIFPKSETKSTLVIQTCRLYFHNFTLCQREKQDEHYRLCGRSQVRRMKHRGCRWVEPLIKQRCSWSAVETNSLPAFTWLSLSANCG